MLFRDDVINRLQFRAYPVNDLYHKYQLINIYGHLNADLYNYSFAECFRLPFYFFSMHILAAFKNIAEEVHNAEKGGLVGSKIGHLFFGFHFIIFDLPELWLSR